MPPINRSSRSALLLALVAGATFNTSDAFISSNSNLDLHHGNFLATSKSATSLAAATNNNNNNNNNSDQSKENNDETPNEIIALPPIGASSFWDRPPEEQGALNIKSDISISQRHQFGVVSPKFQLQYTCKICSHRNSHSVTRMAYRKGVVIAMCKGCESKHLIADNLGWSNYIGGFDFDGGERNIEEFMKNRQEEKMEEVVEGVVVDTSDEEEDLVLRVKKEVFDLEKVLYQSPEGNILSSVGTEDGEGDDGESSWN